MDIPLGVSVHCKDGRCGRSTLIILNPASGVVTHIVVQAPRPTRAERLVPIDWIENTAADVIVLNRLKTDFDHLDLFRSTDFIYTEIPLYAMDPKLTAIWPYVVPTKRIVDDSVQRIEPEKLAIRKGASVRALDGRIGRVEEFIVGERLGRISHLIIRGGPILEKTDVAIPLAYIDHVEEDVVFLNVEKKTISELPHIEVKRNWG